MNYKLFKRFFDFLLSLVLLIVFSPVLLTVSLIILVTMGMPIFFRQSRPGYQGEIFEIIKFRTMTVNKSDQLDISQDSIRLTKVGSIMRKLSLDELPQLINVLKGDMSFIGPRPLLVRYLERYNEDQLRRHNVKPGISGWAQVNGRNNISWEEKFKLDTFYVDNISLSLDIKILFMTILKVLKRDGVSKANSSTTTEFMGND